MSERNTPPGGDRRYDYVPFEKLGPPDQMAARQRYPYGLAWIRDEDYMYPVRRNGRLASARRHLPHDKAKELFNAHAVSEVMES